MTKLKRKDLLLILILAANFGVTGLVYSFYPSPNTGLDEDYLFVFAHITDSHLSKSKEIVEAVVDWLVSKNVSFVLHTGDIVDRKYDQDAWEDSSRIMHQLDNRSLWAVLAGNHDVTNGAFDAENYQKYFSNQSMSQYLVVQDKLLFILFSWNNKDGSISSERLEWMDSVIENHRDKYVIVCLHPHLFGQSLLNIMGVPNHKEIWSHIDQHDNLIMTLSGHIHFNWVQIHSKGEQHVWSISTEALKTKGYVRLFNVYADRIEVHAYSPWKNLKYDKPLDRFTIEFNSNNNDLDGDLWENNLDILPTHPLIPNLALTSLIIAIFLITGRIYLGK